MLVAAWRQYTRDQGDTAVSPSETGGLHKVSILVQASAEILWIEIAIT